MADLSAGRASMPARIAALVGERDGLLAAMPAYLPSAGALTTKLVSLFPRNTDRPTHQAVIVVFDPAHGTPVALMDGEAITAARTAAGSALATDLLARRDARVLAVLGTGVQARAHLRAVPRVRAFAEIRVAGRVERHRARDRGGRDYGGPRPRRARRARRRDEARPHPRRRAHRLQVRRRRGAGRRRGRARPIGRAPREGRARDRPLDPTRDEDDRERGAA